METRVEWKSLREGGKQPSRKRDTDAGYDLYAVDNVMIPVGGMEMVSTGVAIATLPGYYYTIDGRSGLNGKGIIVVRGIIDATYTGEIFAVIINLSNAPYQIHKGDRVAQMILHQQVHARFCEVEEWGADYEQRGTDGWGSSGT